MRKILMLMVIPILFLPNVQAAGWSKIIIKITKKLKSSINSGFSKKIPFPTAAKTIATSDGVRYYDEYGVYLGRIVIRIYSRNYIERRYYDSSDKLIKTEIVEKRD